MRINGVLIAALLSSSILMSACGKREYQIISPTHKVSVDNDKFKVDDDDIYLTRSFAFKTKSGLMRIEDGQQFLPPIKDDNADRNSNKKNEIDEKCYSTKDFYSDDRNHPDKVDLWSSVVDPKELSIVYVKFKDGKLIYADPMEQIVRQEGSSEGDSYVEIEGDILPSGEGINYSDLVIRLGNLSSDFKVKHTWSEEPLILADPENPAEYTPFDLEIKKDEDSESIDDRRVFIYILPEAEYITFDADKPFRVSPDKEFEEDTSTFRNAKKLYSPYRIYIPGLETENSFKAFRKIIVVEFYRGGDIKETMERRIEEHEIDNYKCHYYFDLSVLIEGQSKTQTPVIIDPRNISTGPPFP